MSELLVNGVIKNYQLKDPDLKVATLVATKIINPLVEKEECLGCQTVNLLTSEIS